MPETAAFVPGETSKSLRQSEQALIAACIFIGVTQFSEQVTTLITSDSIGVPS